MHWLPSFRPEISILSLTGMVKSFDQISVRNQVNLLAKYMIFAKNESFFQSVAIRMLPACFFMQICYIVTADRLKRLFGLNELRD
jgi:hypothetical protein